MPLAKDVHQVTTAPSTVRREHHRASGRHRPVSRPSWESEAEIHLIRLCLDLQLDAMLLSLGATAAQTATGTGSGGAQPQSDPSQTQSPPWHRWVLEDVETVRILAADVMSGGAALPATLGTDLDQAVPAAAIDNLVARYESMTALLADILPPDPSGPSAPYRAHAQEVLAHCQARLRELRSTRLEQTPPRGVPVKHLTERPPVPGEWLG